MESGPGLSEPELDISETGRSAIKLVVRDSFDPGLQGLAQARPGPRNHIGPVRVSKPMAVNFGIPYLSMLRTKKGYVKTLPE